MTISGHGCHVCIAGLLLWAGVACSGVCRRPDNNQQPVIGVLTQAWDGGKGAAVGGGGATTTEWPASTTYIAASYVKFVEMAGGRAVPVFDRMNDSYYDFLFHRLNGFLIPGGEADLTKSPYSYASSYFYNKSVELFDETGELFPIMGTCRGFEQLMTLANNLEDPTSAVEVENVLMPVDFTLFALYGHSWLLRDAPHWIIEIMSHKNVTPNFHHWGVLESTYMDTPNMKQVFNVLSTNVDSQGRRFISMVEGVKYPFIGFQFHPEKNIFEWNPDCNLAHDFEGVAMSTYFANAFIELARQSCHRFESQEVLNKLVIWNYSPVFTEQYFTQTYFFPYDI